MSSGKVLLGIVAGAAVGALAGILFAPAKGSKTRKKIVSTGADYVDAVKEKLDELLDVVNDKFENAKNEVTDYAEKVKDDVTDFAEKVKDDVTDYAGKKVSKPAGAKRKAKTAKV